MRMSEKGRALLKSHEGCVLRAYKCPAGVWTIGYGSTGAHVKPNLVITKAEAEALLIKDLSRFEKAVISAIAPAKPSQNEFDAMVSLAFNIGIGNFSKSSVVRQYKLGNKAKAATAFGMWNKAKVNGKLTVLNGLTRRRAEEKQLFLEGAVDNVKRSQSATRVSLVPEGSVVPEAPKSLSKSREVILGGSLGIGSVVNFVSDLTNDDLKEGKQAMEEITAKADGSDLLQELYVPEITSLLAVLIGGFMIWKRFSDRKNGIR